MITVNKTTGILFIACLSLSISSLSWAAPDVLRVWAPNIQSSQFHNAQPLMRRLEEVTGVKAIFNASSDIDTMLQACRDHQIHHTILADIDAEKVIEHCDVEVIATATIDISLFVRNTTSDLTQLKRIGYIARTVSQRIARSELHIDNLDSKLVEFPNHRQAVFALFNDEIDGLIINDQVISHLVSKLKHQVFKQLEFIQLGHVYFLVSSELDASVKNKLQNYYLSDDDVIKKLFYDLAGLHPIRKPEATEEANLQTK